MVCVEGEEPWEGRERMMRLFEPGRSIWAGSFAATIVTLVLCLPVDAQGQGSTSVSPASALVDLHPNRLYPELRWGREASLSGAGVALLAAGLLAPVSDGVVPMQGFNPAAISWSVDRAVVGNQSIDAGTLSDWTRNGAVAFPLLLTLAIVPGGERWHTMGRSSLVFAEAFMVSEGIALLGKTILGRARPYAYLPEAERPGDVLYDISKDRTFGSMPSGHSSSAWTGATMGITEHLLLRPNAGWPERVGVSFLGGALAGSTSALRVEAGQHFPSDVVAGAVIGIVTGVTVPLLHHGDHPLPSTKIWLQAAGSVLVGTLFGVLVT
jgi:membrane-associated phospholipid phosphatase